MPVQGVVDTFDAYFNAKLQQTFQSTKKKRENFHFSRFFIKNSLLTSQCSAMGLRTSLTAFGKRKHKIN